MSVHERLLRLEISAIHGRPLADPDILAVYGWAPHGRALVTRPGLDLVADAGDEFAPEVVPLTVVAAAARYGTTRFDGGPCWVFPHDLPYAPTAGVVVSDADAARRLVRPDNWEPEEWAELIGGERGPWAMALDGDEPVCIAHTPAITEGAAEAGIWTRADHRGLGLAGPVVAAWWRRERVRSAVIFYSTSADNRASRKVARKLDLVPVGWLWRIRPS